MYYNSTCQLQPTKCMPPFSIYLMKDIISIFLIFSEGITKVKVKIIGRITIIHYKSTTRTLMFPVLGFRLGYFCGENVKEILPIY